MASIWRASTAGGIALATAALAVTMFTLADSGSDRVGRSDRSAKARVATDGEANEAEGLGTAVQDAGHLLGGSGYSTGAHLHFDADFASRDGAVIAGDFDYGSRARRELTVVQPEA